MVLWHNGAYVGRFTDFGCVLDTLSTFNEHLDAWDMSIANKKGSMFIRASNFSSDIRSWDVSTVP